MIVAEALTGSKWHGLEWPRVIEREGEGVRPVTIQMAKKKRVVFMLLLLPPTTTNQRISV